MAALQFLVGGLCLSEASNVQLNYKLIGALEKQSALIKTQDEIIEQCAKNQEQFRGLLEHLSQQGTVELTVEKIVSDGNVEFAVGNDTKPKSVH